MSEIIKSLDHPKANHAIKMLEFCIEKRVVDTEYIEVMDVARCQLGNLLEEIGALKNALHRDDHSGIALTELRASEVRLRERKEQFDYTRQLEQAIDAVVEADKAMDQAETAGELMLLATKTHEAIQSLAEVRKG